MKLDIFIQGDPKGQPRPRAFARNMGGKFIARMYDSDIADDWKNRVDSALLLSVVNEGIHAIDGPFRVTMHFGLKRPVSHFNAGGILKKTQGNACLKKPDIDNLAKLVLDRISRNGRIWKDDSQVVELNVTKIWTIKPQSYCRLYIEGQAANLIEVPRE